MSVGSLVLDFTSIVETVSLFLRATKRVLPSGVTACPAGNGPTGMSAGSLVLVLTSIVETVPLPVLTTKPVDRPSLRANTADTSSATTPTGAPANPTTTTPRTHRNRGITSPALLSSPAPVGPTGAAYAAFGLPIRRTPHQPSRARGCAEIDDARHSRPERLKPPIFSARSHITADSGTAFVAL